MTIFQNFPNSTFMIEMVWFHNGITGHHRSMSFMNNLLKVILGDLSGQGLRIGFKKTLHAVWLLLPPRPQIATLHPLCVLTNDGNHTDMYRACWGFELILVFFLTTPKCFPLFDAVMYPLLKTENYAGQNLPDEDDPTPKWLEHLAINFSDTFVGDFGSLIKKRRRSCIEKDVAGFIKFALETILMNTIVKYYHKNYHVHGKILN